METQFKDVAHLYKGCKCQYGHEDRKRVGALVGNDERFGLQLTAPHSPIVGYHFCRVELVKPILRPLSDITAEECQKYLSFYNDSNKYLSHNGKMMRALYKDDTGFIGDFEDDEEVSTEYNPNGRLFWMLSKRFDLFGLIESGQAIDATTLTPNPYANA